jgi:hypothetical protein|tara:strand:- start:645 stop:746 length:102 start_codon:yes stop_codon:yes gene_type:complete
MSLAISAAEPDIQEPLERLFDTLVTEDIMGSYL